MGPFINSAVHYRVANNFMRLCFTLFSRWQVEGAEHVPSRGPFIAVANHSHYLDPPLINASLSRKVLFLAKRELTQTPGWPGWCIVHYGFIPLDRERFDREALRRAQEVLEKGGAVGLFPEGTRSRTGQLQEARPAAAFLAIQSGVPILPIAISGAGSLGSLRHALPRRPPITVRIGPIFQLPTPLSPSREVIVSASHSMMERIAALLSPELRGVYGAGRGATPPAP
ncbi:MAG: 1-acyl-sn-glycerol-3-phosphate acyltransferase [Chloroflexi bacterium]|nr:1-acyl-sn-glycerol-3-phosphate acyltransferase [Chloroflexota bacterium]